MLMADKQAPEIRTDPILGHRVLLAPERRWNVSQQARVAEPPSTELCPFCRGNEHLTPDGLLQLDEKGQQSDSWVVRAIPNRFPALTKAASADDGIPSEESPIAFRIEPGHGHHEVLIESADHVDAVTDLPVEHYGHIIRLWLSRSRTMSDRPGIVHATLFKNSGWPAGISIPHIHSQLIGTAFVPHLIRAKMAAATPFYRKHDRTIWSEVLRHELADGDRIVNANRDFVVLCPFASRFDFETCIIPRRECPHFTELTPAEEHSFAETLHDTLLQLSRCLPDPAFNLAVQTAPYASGPSDGFHWHVEITPRTARIAGFEIASGESIITVAPETAAMQLRSAEL